MKCGEHKILNPHAMFSVSAWTEEWRYIRQTKWSDGFFKGRTANMRRNKQNHWSHFILGSNTLLPTRSNRFSFNMESTPNFSKLSLDERRRFAIDLTCQVYLLYESNHILCRINGKVIIICFVGFNVRGGNLSIFRNMFYLFIGFTLFHCHSCFATGYTVKVTF